VAVAAGNGGDEKAENGGLVSARWNGTVQGQETTPLSNLNHFDSP